MVIVIEGNRDATVDLTDVKKMLQNLLHNSSLKEAVKEVSDSLRLNKKQVYDIALHLLQKGGA